MAPYLQLQPGLPPPPPPPRALPLVTTSAKVAITAQVQMSLQRQGLVAKATRCHEGAEAAYGEEARDAGAGNKCQTPRPEPVSASVKLRFS